MDYEKAYKDALERAKKIHDSPNASSGRKEWLESIFPELAESEDERMINEIIHTVTGFHPIHTTEEIDSMVAYLEKQKESLHVSETCKENADSFTYEDERIRKALLEFLEDVWHMGKDANFDRWGKADCADWIVYLERQKEQKPAEMDNEEIELSDFESELFSAFSDGWQQYLHGEEVNVAQWAKEHSAQLLNAAKKEQQPAEWSEEDEKMLRTIISDGSRGVELDSKQIDFLKSLRPQPHWKPSEKQMDALGEAIYQLHGGVYSAAIDSLYKDLKKPM